jgi:hypothetical protein
MSDHKIKTNLTELPQPKMSESDLFLLKEFVSMAELGKVGTFALTFENKDEGQVYSAFSSGVNYFKLLGMVTELGHELRRNSCDCGEE